MKPVEIQLKTEGGQAAANEIHKVTAAADELADKLQAPSGNAGLAPAAKKVKNELGEIPKVAPEVQRSTRNMGSAVLTFSQGLEDAQYGIRGVLNNIPSLILQLGGTMGLAGVVSMAAVSLSVLGPKIAGLFGDGETKEKADELTEALDKLNKKSIELAGEKSAIAAQEWLDALDDEEQAYLDQNTAIARQIELIRARRDAQLGVDTARRDAEIATIEADPKKDEATKIREVAKVRDADEKARAKAKMEDLAAAKNIAAIEAQRLTGIAARKKADADANAGRIKALEEEKQALSGRVQAADLAKESIPGIEAGIKGKQENILRTQGMLAGSKQGQDALRKALEPMIAELEAAKLAAGAASRDDRKRLGVLNSEDEGKNELLKFRGAQNALNDQLKTAEDAAKAAADRAKQAAELEKIKSPAIRDEFSARSQARNTTAEAAARAAEARAKEESDRNTDQASRRQAAAEIARRQAELDARGRAFGARIDKSETTNPTARIVANRLYDDTDGRELASLSREVDQGAGNMSAAMLDVLRTTLKEMKSMADEITNMKGQISRNRTGK